jgi:glycosyltransferase involved in cell wall biosynthesis
MKLIKAAMRVLNVQLRYICGGNPQVCLDYTRALKKSGNKVFVLTNPDDPFMDQHNAIADRVIPSKKLGKSSYDIFSIIYFKKLIKQIKPDVIIAHEGRSAALFKRAAKKSIKVVDVNHGRGSRQSRKMDATIVINNSQLVRGGEILGENHPIFCVPNSINLEGHKQPAMPKKWQNTPVIGTIGRFVDDKAFDIFIEALAVLDSRGVKFLAKMGGCGEEREALVALVEKHNLQQKISMTGWVKNPDQFYKAIDIFCLPSRQEAFGLVLLEAYRHGIPAVVSDAEGPADIVQNRKDALMVPKNNAERLADALQELLENKQMADSFAQAGYEKLIRKYDIPVVAKTLQAVLQEVVSIPNNNPALNTHLTGELFAYSKS